ncbi:orotate phosphoribosyltransferase [Trueperella pyogenes]|uniref:orotate phosphoribosyltransferase n=1 Tax=Trueperella pyogenes TaxID=1661 RepID=UPI000D25AC1D|nr:orotate phosphoribosyltransferase [Trueperella pyogenes]AWA44057.1 orotate phosphoribosyltransferase [Trueperella pyogenes]
MALTDLEILAELRDTDAIAHGHFALTSGRHSDTYIQCARVLESPDVTVTLAREAVRRLPAGLDVDLVASPAVGGMLFGFAVALALHKRFVFTERVEGKMRLRRSFHIPAGAQVLIVEDVVTTGGSVAEVEELVKAAGGEVVGVVSIIDRKTDRKFAAPFYPLLTLPTESWDPSECSMCGAGEELDSPGSRRL